MGQYKLNPGDIAPDFELPAWPEGTLKLSDLRGRWVVLYFYPKDNTPGCTNESRDFRDALDEFTAANAVVVGVSRDSLRSHQRFAEKHQLNFTLVADEDERACRAYDVIQLKKLYGKESLGVERSTFLIDPDGVIRQAWRKVRVKGHVAEVLQTLKSMQE